MYRNIGKASGKRSSNNENSMVGNPWIIGILTLSGSDQSLSQLKLSLAFTFTL
jgi:hypothetical protein